MEFLMMTNYSSETTKAVVMSDYNVTTLSPEVKKKLLGTLNLKQTIKYSPVLAVYILMMVIGLIGNAFVLYIYKFKFKRTSARTYILCLALLDFLVCCVGIPYHAFDLTHLVTYKYSTLCRVLSFLSGAVNLGSVFLLIVVAVDRYLKVCRPLKKQLIDFGDRRACAIAIISAIIISIPNAILYGNSTVEVEGLTGIECFIDDEFSESMFAIAYLGFYILVFISCVVTLIGLYFFICREIYRNQALQVADNSQRRRGCLSCTVANDSDSDNDSDDSSHERDTLAMTTMSEFVSDIDKTEHLPEEGKRILPNYKQELPEATEEVADQLKPAATSEKDSEDTHVQESLLKNDELTAGTIATKQESPQLRKKPTTKTTKKERKHKSVKPMNSSALVRHTTQGAKEKHTRKITLMMLTITVVFIVCYFPFIIISLLDSSDDQYWERMTSSEAIFVDFMLRFYLINNMANAIIYSFWDERFRRECILIIRKLFCFCKRMKK